MLPEVVDGLDVGDRIGHQLEDDEQTFVEGLLLSWLKLEECNGFVILLSSWLKLDESMPIRRLEQQIVLFFGRGC